MSSSVYEKAAAALACAALCAAPNPAEANGRFPAASYVVIGPGAQSSRIALRTTFGLLLSVDSGRTWGWVCEEALDAVGTFDPSISLGGDGTIVLALERGLSVSSNGCAWAAPPNTPARPIVDVTHDASGRVVIAAIGPSGVYDALLRSDDHGHTWRERARTPGYFLETVDVAPNAPQRVYVTAFVQGPEPVLLRSDDGGERLREMTRDFPGGLSAWLAGVDPTNPDVVYVRSVPTSAVGSILFRSENGGMSFREVARTAGEMRGFAISEDGRTVWIGSSDPNEALRRSVDGGAFARVGGRVTVNCLRHHAGLLYVCADEASDGYALGCSSDGGERIDPILSLRRVPGPVACPGGTSVGSRCGPAWPAQRDRLRAIDASAPRAPVLHGVPLDASEPADAAGALEDRPVRADASAPPPAGRCDCDVPGGSRGAWAAWLFVLAFVRRRSRSSAGPS